MKYRMYFLVPYNISNIQKGIQAGHCIEKFFNLYRDSDEYKSYFKNDMTWILLNGGTTNDSFGELNFILKQLEDNDIPHGDFREPDLNNALTAICFLADERVWDLENYPEWEDYDELLRVGGGRFTVARTYSEWLDMIGGKDNLFLRNLIKDKHLA
jgi:hypothetical protein